MKRLIIHITFIIVCITSVDAQKPPYTFNPKLELSQFIFDKWTMDNGLPSNSLLYITQTQDHYLWISSYNGLIRFDGKDFEIFTKNNTPALKNNVVMEMIEDNLGNLWLTTQGSGLIKYNNGKFTANINPYKPNAYYLNICIDDNNIIWVGTQDNGVYNFYNKKFTPLLKDSLLQHATITALTKDKTGKIWIGTNGIGLYVYDHGTLHKYTTSDGILSNHQEFIYSDSENNIWISTDNGICYFKDDKFIGIKELSDYYASGIYEDAMNTVWIASNKGLARFFKKTGEVKLLPIIGNFRSSYLYDLVIDHEGSLWITSYRGGLVRLRPGNYTNFGMSEGLDGNTVNAVTENNDGKILIGFDNGRIDYLDNNKALPFNLLPELKGKRIRHLLQDCRGNIWAASYSGVYKVSQSQKTIYNQKTGFPDDMARFVFEDFDKNIWIGTRDAGVIKMLNNNSFEVYNSDNGLRTNLVLSINQHTDSSIVVTTGGGGVSFIKNQKIYKTFTRDEGLISNIVFNSYIDSNGVVWLACNGGVSRIENDEITSYTKQTGLKNESPYDIIEDDSLTFWMPCTAGLMKASKTEMNRFANNETDKISCRLYTKTDGIKEPECTSTTKSLRTRNGLMIFPTVDGLTIIDPLYLQSNTLAPKLSVKKIESNLETYTDFSLPICINPDEKNLTFYFTALSLYAPEKVLFKYRLKGYDDEWQLAGTRRIAYYTNLSGKDYVFEVLACNNDGIWAKNPASVKITKKPHFYETKWFYTVTAFGFGLLFFVFYRLRISTLKRKQRELERTVKERTIEITEKNIALTLQKAEIHQKAEELENANHYILEKNEELNQQKEEIQSQAEHLEDANKQILEINKELENGKEELEVTIEELKKAQTQLVQSEKMSSLGQLTAGIAHEFNNPVNFVYVGIDILTENLQELKEYIDSLLEIDTDNKSEIKGAITILKEKFYAENYFDDVNELTKSIKSGAKRTKIIVDSLRSFSMLDQDVFKKTNIHNGIEATLTILENQLGDRISVVKDFGKIPIIRCFPGQLNQVIINIMQNAIQAIPDKGKITIKTYKSKNNLHVCISIKDTGKGISEEILPKIFDPFFTTRDVGEGTGLGLSISHGIIKNHKGKIEVFSKVDKGSEFIIFLPLNL